MKTRLIPFVFSVDDTALLELTSSGMRVWVDEVAVSFLGESATYTRGVVTNGEFTSDITSWTDISEAGGTIAWVGSAHGATGLLGLTGTGTNVGAASQEVLVTTGPGITVGRHHILISVTRGPVLFSVGTTSGTDDIFAEVSLKTGEHALSFTPTGDFFLRLRNRLPIQKLVDSILLLAVAENTTTALQVTTPWAEASLEHLRWIQSGDVIFVACKDQQQYRIERRATDSWSVVLYNPDDGPFGLENTTPTTIAPGALVGNTTLTASQAIFDPDHVGALFRASSTGQIVTASIAAANTFTDPIRVTSVGEARRFAISITGTWVATLTLQRSISAPGSWEDVVSYTTNQDITYLDALDNQVIYYRIGTKVAAYTSGTAEARLSISVGAITGIARVTGYTSSTVVSVEVLTDFGGTDATDVWAEGLWSEYRGWPTAVALHDARLWWAGKDRILGSVTDAYDSFDDTLEGDAGPISRSIGFGPVDSINWLLSLDRLVIGTDMRELVCRSSSLDEPLTPTNFTVKQSGSQGSAAVQAVEIDNKAVFLQRGRWRVYEMAYALEANNYAEVDLTQICPEFLSPGIIAMAVQRQPDTRIHCVRSDGTVGLLVFDRTENLICWMNVETDGAGGAVEEVTVLPNDEEDRVYYIVKRTIGGVDYRYLERWAKETECRGASMNLQADSFVYEAAEANTITGLDHLEGETVVVWAGGLDLGEFTVAAGSVTLPASYPDRCAGLTYRARFKSSKLAYIAPPGKSALGAAKRIGELGLVLADTHAQGLTFGESFDFLDPMPLVEEGVVVDGDSVWDNYEGRLIPFPGTWTTDARLCLEGNAPRPATVMAVVVDMDSNP